VLALYGDGRLIVPGPQTEIYPGPALPNLQARTVSEAGIQAILAAARGAGLLGPDRQYVSGGIADAPTTAFTVVAGGSRHVVSVNALNEGGARSDAVARIAAFQSKMTDLGSWLPHGSLGPEQPYVADELRVYAMPYEGQKDLPQRRTDWPVGGFGGYRPVLDVAGIRCGTVFGVALQKVLAAAGTANELTPWKADGKLWTLIFRPLLPDESGCS
jgi:hypothetical protein